MSPSILDPPDRDEYRRFCNAVSGAIVELNWLPLSLRYKIAGRAWRILHPDSRCGQP